MFGLIRYKFDDFSGNSNSNMRSVVVMLDISLMSDSRVICEYKLHGLSELIHLDKSCN